MRKSKEDWLKTGLKTLAETSLPGLTIDRMAGDLELTKGSFYHHFANMADFEDQLVAFWAVQYLSTAAAVPGAPAAALALLDTIMVEAFNPVTGPEVAIRAWAEQDDRVRDYVQRVDQARRAFVLGVFRVLVADEQQAGRMADILFTMLIGSIMALPRFAPPQVLALYTEFKRLYGLGGVS